MSLVRARLAAVLVLPLSVALCASVADAKPKKKKEQPAGGDMTFEPEAVGTQDAEPPKPAAPAPRAAPARAKSTRPAGNPNTPAGPASKTLERALKLYDAQDYPMASIELNKVIEGQSGDDEANKQRAEFFMGKALFNLKFYSASLSYFDRIVQTGPNHRYYQKTLQWLASLSRFLPESAGVLEKIGKYTKRDLEQEALAEFRDELYYLLGRYFFSKSQFNEAKDLFASVPEKSEFYPKAKFFEGMTWVREAKIQSDAQQSSKAALIKASEAFKAILRKGAIYKDEKKMPKALREFVELANLSLGRVFYSAAQYPLSIKYFEKLEPKSPDWVESLFEASWSYFQVDGDSKALGNIHSVNSPFFDQEFYPETFILKAVIYFNRCNYEQAREAIEEFNNIYPELRKQIDEVLAKQADNAQLFDYIVKIKTGEAGLTGRVQRAAEGALNDKTLAKSIEYVSELDRELKALDKADPAWKSTAVAGTILQDLTLQQSLAKNEAGQLARSRLQRLSDEVRALTKDAIKVEFETLNALKGQLTAGLAADQNVINPNAKNFNVIQIDDEHQQWPFRGEYWKDELGFYRFKVANKCGR
jgi:tetratricopeptide (TPR) repeat protein